MTIETEFQQAMAPRGLECRDPIIFDGKVHRFLVGNDIKVPTGWYVLWH
jgi:hypothetical protein